MASPSTRAELITYCKRQLGEPVLQVNIDDEQVNNVIDDTFQFFQENCYNGMERAYLYHTKSVLMIKLVLLQLLLNQLLMVELLTGWKLRTTFQFLIM